MREIHAELERMKQITVREREEGDEVIFTPVVPKRYKYPRIKTPKPESYVSRGITLPAASLIERIPPMNEETIRAIRALPNVNSPSGYTPWVERKNGEWRMPSNVPPAVRAIFSTVLQHEVAINPDANNCVCNLDIRCVSRQEFLALQKTTYSNNEIHRDTKRLQTSSYFVTSRFPTLLATGTAKISLKDRWRLFRGQETAGALEQRAAEAAARGETDFPGMSQVVPGALVRFAGNGQEVWHAVPFLDLEDKDMREHLEKHWPPDEYRIFIRVVFAPNSP